MKRRTTKHEPKGTPIDFPSKHSASELIQMRTSWRSCTGEEIPPQTRHLLETFIHQQLKTFQDRIRLQLVASQPGDGETLKGLGTYGFIRGAGGFLIGAVDRSQDNLEAYGHCLQNIVLAATGLGLATCWLGGTFYKDAFSRRIHTQDHEVVPAVVSVGVPANKRNWVDRVIRNVAGSRKRLPWEQIFFSTDQTTPLSRKQAGKLAPALDMLRLSPSASNKQPWRLVLEGSQMHFFLQRTPGYRKPMFSDLQRIDMGIAMSHFEAMCTELKISGSWNNSPPAPNPPADREYITTHVLD